MTSIPTRVVQVFAVCITLITLCFTAAHSQNKSTEKIAIVAGTIYNSDNRPIENAAVTLESDDHLRKFTVHSGSDGRYRFENVPAGNYRLRAFKSGYRDTQEGPFSLRQEEQKTVALRLPREESAPATKDNPAEPQFSDEIHFNVAGVSDPSNLGGHGSDTVLRTKETLAKETASLNREAATPPSKNSDPTADAANTHVRLAEAAETDGRPLDAVHEYQQAAELQPNEPHLFAWGADLLLHRAFEPAIEIFTKGHRLYPDSVRMLLGLSVATYDQGSTEQGKKLLLEACDLSPTGATPYLFLGQLQEAEKIEPQGWTEKFARFVQLHPENALAHYHFAVALAKQETSRNNAALIESELKRAIEIDPQLGPAYLQLSILYSLRNDYQRAISSLQKAIQLTPLPAEAHYRLAQVYEYTGASEQSRREIELFKQTSEQKNSEAERERHKIQQFVYTLRSQSPSSAPPASEPH
jgi:tetratricopeptide (TPR) repeat protein